MSSTFSAESSTRMTSGEIRAGLSLASIFALRMLGMFLILPVFAVHAKSLPGGNDATLVGLALGMYGLAQFFGQIPFGIASDKYGRKRIIIIGLILFALGSVVAAMATDIVWMMIGRAIQGAGAISAAITAFIADLTREEHRTKAMAMVGGSIGLTFAVSMVASPLLYQAIGMNGIFVLIGMLSVVAILVVAFVVPDAPIQSIVTRVPFSTVLRNAELMRLNYGVFALHLTQMAMFMVIPSALVEYAGIPVTGHWKIYLPVIVCSIVFMLPPLFISERRGKTKQIFLAAITLMLFVQIGFWAFLSHPTLPWFVLVILLLAFFVAFNILEASQPSLVSRLAPPSAKGAALGVYNTLQALSLFCGGALGGWLKQNTGAANVFLLSAALMTGWLIIASNMKNLPRRTPVAAGAQ